MLLILTKSQYETILERQGISCTAKGVLHDSGGYLGTAVPQEELIQISVNHLIYPIILQTLNTILFREDQKMKRDLLHEQRKQSSLKGDPRMFNKILSKFEDAEMDELASDYPGVDPLSL